MKLRLPILLTLAPLLVAGGAYYRFWSGQRDMFAAQAAAVLGSDHIATGGFPYRIEGDAGPLSITRSGGGASLRFATDRVVFNRQPWGAPLVVGHVGAPKLDVAAPGIDGATLSVRAASAQASLRWADSRLARLSAVFSDATVATGLLPVPFTAPAFELHVRETPTTLDPASRAPTGPQQAQLVMSATGARFGRGDPLAVDVNLGLTAAAPVRDVRVWQSGGTVEVRRFAITDAVGEIATLTATISPDSAGHLLVAGTLSTVCPRTISALFSGESAPVEYRARRARSFALRGAPGRPELVAPPGESGRIAERRQQPPCPVLFRG